MNLEIRVDKDTCFYYWIQVMSSWSSHPIEKELLNYYQRVSDVSAEDKVTALDNIRRVLQNASDPRRLLADLYSGEAQTSEAKKVIEQGRLLRDTFEPVWQTSLQHLEKAADYLNAVDFKLFSQPLERIIDFLDADFNIQSRRTVYLLPNPMQQGAVGHTINKTDFILVRPSGDKSSIAAQDTIMTIMHEYIHAIEQRSRVSRVAMRRSYEKYIGNNILAPSGYTWKDMYVESLIYCFASKTIGGLLSLEVYHKPTMNILAAQDDFQKLVIKKRYTSYQLMNWVALNILPDVEEYIATKRALDQSVADKMSGIFIEYV